MAKRYRRVKAKRGELLVKWGKAESYDDPSVVYAHGADGADKSDARILSEIFEGFNVYEGRNLVQELEHRGYDLETLRFSVMQKDAVK